MTRRFRLEARLYRATRNNELREELSAEIVDGEIEANQDARSQMVFRAETTAPARLEPHVDCIAPFLKVTYDDGRVDEGQVGLYVVLPPEEITHRPTHSLEVIDGRDVTWFLDADTFDEPYTAPAGVDYVDAAIAIFRSSPLERISIPRSGVLIPEPITWQPGASKLDMGNQLLNAVGYYTVWPDSTGRLVSIPYVDMAAMSPARRYVAGETAEIVGDVIEEKEYTSLANVIVVVAEGHGDSDDIIAIRRNDNPASPISTASLGVTIRRRETANVETQAAADALADRLLQESMSYYRRLRLRAFPDPRRGLHEVIDVELSRRGEVDPVVAGRWWVRAWKLGLTMNAPYIEYQANRVERW